MNKIRKLSFSVSPEMEQQIIELRKTDAYCRMSIAEIIRMLIERGIVELATDSAQ